MAKKIPLRKCVATGEMLPKKELLRIVKTPDNQVQVDLTGKANGRGAYLKKSKEAVEFARKHGSLKKALGIDVTDDVYEQILDAITK